MYVIQFTEIGVRVPRGPLCDIQGTDGAFDRVTGREYEHESAKRMTSSAIRSQGITEPDASAHIVLETPEDEAGWYRRPEHVVARFALKSRIRGARVELTLYEEGFLEVDEQYRGKRAAKRLLDLRYLDPRPTVSRIFATRMAHLALGFGGATGALGALAWLGVMPIVTVPATLLLGCAAGMSAWLFLCRTGEQGVFYTTNGRAKVLTLFGSVGSIRALRRIVPAVVAAVRTLKDPASADKRVYLRREMREHYRLAQGGIISAEDCATSTLRILKQFDSGPANP